MTDTQSNIGNKNVNMLAAALALSALSGCGSSPDRQAEQPQAEEVTANSTDGEKDRGRHFASGVLEAAMAEGKLPAGSYIRSGNQIVYLSDPDLTSKLIVMAPYQYSTEAGEMDGSMGSYGDDVKLVVGGTGGSTACVIEFDNASAGNFLDIARGQAMAEHPATPADIQKLCGVVNTPGTFGMRVTYSDSFRGEAPTSQAPNGNVNVSSVVIDGRQALGNVAER